jgi:hypothetical protein
MNQSQRTRLAGFTLIALIGLVIGYQILIIVGVLIPAVTNMLRYSSFIVTLILILALFVVLEKIGIIRLFRMKRVINGVLWFSAAFLLFSAILTIVLPGVFGLALLAFVGSVLSWIVARAPFIEKT